VIPAALYHRFSTVDQNPRAARQELRATAKRLGLRVIQQLYRVDRSSSYGAIDTLFRGTVDVALIRKQWDQLVRVSSSLRNRTAPSHVIPSGTYDFERVANGGCPLP
jgi:hypothetical protein